MKDLAIIGAGAAGMTAAIYAKRAGLDLVLIDQTMYGGQLTATNEVENYPGVPKIPGVDLATRIYEQVNAMQVEARWEPVLSLTATGDAKRLHFTGEELSCRALIAAMGAKRRKIGCPGEERLSGRGVSYCATCDGAFFARQSVAVVGGGNTALEDAAYLANICEKVYLIHRRDSFRGEKLLIDAVEQKENMVKLMGYSVQEILGEQKVSGLRLLNQAKNEARTLSVSGVFVAVGLEPDTALLKNHIALDQWGYAVAGEDCATSIPGLYVAGDLRQKPLRQIVTAVADGAVAAAQAAHYLNTAGLAGK